MVAELVQPQLQQVGGGLGNANLAARAGSEGTEEGVLFLTFSWKGGCLIYTTCSYLNS